ncbi:MAG: hypothetical protein LUQ65_14135, partial [Candidatus Helarchaeota archaeon]|nr:hypothetical protein [Candidatus Helarchaeota archaeon]
AIGAWQQSVVQSMPQEPFPPFLKEIPGSRPCGLFPELSCYPSRDFFFREELYIKKKNMSTYL